MKAEEMKQLSAELNYELKEMNRMLSGSVPKKQLEEKVLIVIGRMKVMIDDALKGVDSSSDGGDAGGDSNSAERPTEAADRESTVVDLLKRMTRVESELERLFRIL